MYGTVYCGLGEEGETEISVVSWCVGQVCPATDILTTILTPLGPNLKDMHPATKLYCYAMLCTVL